MKLKEFNFENFKNWFNKEFNDAGYYLNEGMFPNDGETGINPAGYEIAVLVYPEGIDIIDCIDFLSEKYPEFTKDFNSVKEEKRGRLKRRCKLLPFEEKYIPVFETIAVESCKDHMEIVMELKELTSEGGEYGPIELNITLQNFLNGGTEDWRNFTKDKHKKSKR